MMEHSIVSKYETWIRIRKTHFLAQAEISNQVYILEFFHPPAHRGISIESSFTLGNATQLESISLRESRSFGDFPKAKRPNTALGRRGMRTAASCLFDSPQKLKKKSFWPRSCHCGILGDNRNKVFIFLLDTTSLEYHDMTMRTHHEYYCMNSQPRDKTFLDGRGVVYYCLFLSYFQIYCIHL
jgi:hypothetical protein